MRNFSPGLFDRLAEPEPAPANRQQARAQAQQRCRDSITRDLVALLNTRSALQADALQPWPAVRSSVLTYGLIDFAGMCMTSDTDQQQICRAVKLAIERHEPRLHKVDVTLRPGKDSINRVAFAITAELKGAIDGEPMAFDAVFRPSLQQYSIENVS
jgi:type VI secretion system protein ImpF